MNSSQENFNNNGSIGLATSGGTQSSTPSSASVSDKTHANASAGNNNNKNVAAIKTPKSQSIEATMTAGAIVVKTDQTKKSLEGAGSKRLIRTIRPIDVRKLQQSGLDRKIAEALSKQKQQNTKLNKLPTVSVASEVSKPLTTFSPSSIRTQTPTSVTKPKPTPNSAAASTSSSRKLPIVPPPPTSKPSLAVAAATPKQSFMMKPIVPPKITITAPEASMTSNDNKQTLQTHQEHMKNFSPEQRMRHVKSLLHKKLLQRQNSGEGQKLFIHLKPPSNEIITPKPQPPTQASSSSSSSSPSPTPSQTRYKSSKQLLQIPDKAALHPTSSTIQPPEIRVIKDGQITQLLPTKPRIINGSKQQLQKSQVTNYEATYNKQRAQPPAPPPPTLANFERQAPALPTQKSFNHQPALPRNEWAQQTLFRKYDDMPCMPAKSYSCPNMEKAAPVAPTQFRDYAPQLPYRGPVNSDGKHWVTLQDPEKIDGKLVATSLSSLDNKSFLPYAPTNSGQRIYHPKPVQNNSQAQFYCNASTGSNTYSCVDSYFTPTTPQNLPNTQEPSVLSYNKPPVTKILLKTLPTPFNTAGKQQVAPQSPIINVRNSDEIFETTPTNKLPTKPKTPQKSPQDIARKLNFENNSPREGAATTNTAFMMHDLLYTNTPPNGIPKASIRPVYTPPSIARQRIVVPDVSPLKTPFPTSNVPEESPLPNIDTFKKPYPLPDNSYYQMLPTETSEQITINYHVEECQTTDTNSNASPSDEIQPDQSHEYNEIPSMHMAAPNSLIVLENKVLSQDEMIDLTALRLSTSKVNARFARPHKPIPEVVIKQEKPDDTVITESGQTVKSNAQHNKNIGLTLISSKQNRKYIVNASKLKLPPEKIADLAKKIAERTAANRRNATIAGLAPNEIKIKEETSQETTRRVWIQTTEPLGANNVNNQQQHQQKLMYQNPPQQIMGNFIENACQQTQTQPQQQQQLNNFAKKIFLIVKKEPQTSSTTSTSSLMNNTVDNNFPFKLEPSTKQERRSPSPSKPPKVPFKYSPTKFRHSAAEIIDITDDEAEDTFSAVDFIASLNKGNPITEETELELSPEELNLNASCSMNFSPLRIPFSPRKSKVSTSQIEKAPSEIDEVLKENSIDIGKIVMLDGDNRVVKIEPQKLSLTGAGTTRDNESVMVDTIVIESSKGRDHVSLRKSVDKPFNTTCQVGEELRAKNHSNGLKECQNTIPRGDNDELEPEEMIRISRQNASNESDEKLPKVPETEKAIAEETDVNLEVEHITNKSAKAHSENTSMLSSINRSHDEQNNEQAPVRSLQVKQISIKVVSPSKLSPLKQSTTNKLCKKKENLGEEEPKAKEYLKVKEMAEPKRESIAENQLFSDRKEVEVIKELLPQQTIASTITNKSCQSYATDMPTQDLSLPTIVAVPEKAINLKSILKVGSTSVTESPHTTALEVTNSQNSAQDTAIPNAVYDTSGAVEGNVTAPIVSKRISRFKKGKINLVQRNKASPGVNKGGHSSVTSSTEKENKLACETKTPSDVHNKEGEEKTNLDPHETLKQSFSITNERLKERYTPEILAAGEAMLDLAQRSLMTSGKSVSTSNETMGVDHRISSQDTITNTEIIHESDYQGLTTNMTEMVTEDQNFQSSRQTEEMHISKTPLEPVAKTFEASNLETIHVGENVLISNSSQAKVLEQMMVKATFQANDDNSLVSSIDYIVTAESASEEISNTSLPATDENIIPQASCQVSKSPKELNLTATSLAKDGSKMVSSIDSAASSKSAVEETLNTLLPVTDENINPQASCQVSQLSESLALAAPTLAKEDKVSSIDYMVSSKYRTQETPNTLLPLTEFHIPPPVSNKREKTAAAATDSNIAQKETTIVATTPEPTIVTETSHKVAENELTESKHLNSPKIITTGMSEVSQEASIATNTALNKSQISDTVFMEPHHELINFSENSPKITEEAIPMQQKVTTPTQITTVENVFLQDKESSHQQQDLPTNKMDTQSKITSDVMANVIGLKESITTISPEDPSNYGFISQLLHPHQIPKRKSVGKETNEISPQSSATIPKELRKAAVSLIDIVKNPPKDIQGSPPQIPFKKKVEPKPKIVSTLEEIKGIKNLLLKIKKTDNTEEKGDSVEKEDENNRVNVSKENELKSQTPKEVISKELVPESGNINTEAKQTLAIDSKTFCLATKAFAKTETAPMHTTSSETKDESLEPAKNSNKLETKSKACHRKRRKSEGDFQHPSNNKINEVEKSPYEDNTLPSGLIKQPYIPSPIRRRRSTRLGLCSLAEDSTENLTNKTKAKEQKVPETKVSKTTRRQQKSMPELKEEIFNKAKGDQTISPRTTDTLFDTIKNTDTGTTRRTRFSSKPCDFEQLRTRDKDAGLCSNFLDVEASYPDSKEEEIPPASNQRKRLRKTLNDIKKSHKKNSSDSEDEERDFDTAHDGEIPTTDFLGFDDNSVGYKKNRNTNMEAENGKNSPINASTTKGGTLKNWLTTGKAISPTSPKEGISKRLRHDKKSEAICGIPLKKRRWEACHKAITTFVETDITDDESPANDEDNDLLEIKHNTRNVKTVMMNSSHKPAAKPKRIKLNVDGESLQTIKPAFIEPKPMPTLVRSKVSETDSDTPIWSGKRIKKPRRRLISDDFKDEFKNTTIEVLEAKTEEQLRTAEVPKKSQSIAKTKEAKESTDTKDDKIEANKEEIIVSKTKKKRGRKSLKEREELKTESSIITSAIVDNSPDPKEVLPKENKTETPIKDNAKLEEVTPKVKGKRGRKRKAPAEELSVETKQGTTPITSTPTAAGITRTPGRARVATDNPFNPRLLLIRKREQLDSNEVLTEANSGSGPVQCGLCLKRTKEAKWVTHLAEHYGVGWQVGEQEMNVIYRPAVINSITGYIKDTEIKGVNCRMCGRLYRSGLGMIMHIETCGLERQRVDCEFCHRNYSSTSYVAHVRLCPARIKLSKSQYEPTNKEGEEELLTATGRAKRHSTIRAETRLKQMGEEILKEKEDSPDFNALDYVKYNGPLGEEVRQKWSSDIGKFDKAFCPKKMCTFVSDKLEELEDHITKCRYVMKVGYYCAFCKHRYFENEKKAIQHVLEAHKSSEDFMGSDSDCDIKTGDEASTNGEDDDEDDNLSEEADDGDMENSSKSAARKTPKQKRSRSSKPRCPPKSNAAAVILRKRVFQRRTRDGPAEIVHQKWHSFTTSNYTSEVLFNDFKSHHSVLETQQYTKHLPCQEISMKFVLSTSTQLHSSIGEPQTGLEWQQIQRFQTINNANDTFLFVGSPVICCQWLPLPANATEQYLLVVYRKDMFKYTKLLNPKRHRSSLLIFKVTQEKHGKKSRNPHIQLHYGVTIENAPIYNISFLPSGGYNQDENRLGLVAVASVESNIKVYSLPLKLQKNKQQDDIPLIKIAPSFELKLDLLDQEETTKHVLMEPQCLQIHWSQYAGHNHIFASFSNGFVGIWDITNDSQENLNRFEMNGGESIQYTPLNYFFTGEKGIKHFALHYDPMGPRWLAVNTFCRKFVIYDIRNLTQPIPLKEDYAKNIVRCMDWCPLWEPVMVAYCDSIPNNGRCVLNINPTNIMFQQQRLDNFVSAVTGIHYTPISNMCVASVDNGDILFMDPREIHYEHVVGKKFGERRILASMDVKQLDGKPIQRVNNNKKNECKDLEGEWCMHEYDYKEKYGLVFKPLMKLSESMKNAYFNVNRRAPLNITPYMRINALRCNLNKGAKHLVAAGYENGFIRVIYFNKNTQFQNW